MIKNPTTFVIGAGASSEVGFPLGGQLLANIAEDLNFRFDAGYQTKGDKDLYQYLQRNFGDRARGLVESGRRLSAVLGTFLSMDEALHYFSSDHDAVEIGKVCIANRIMQAEKAALGKTSLIDAAAESWLPIFLSLALSGHTRESVRAAFSYVTIVCFNYDRLIEQYLCKALQASAGISETEAATIVTDLQILRPYGGLGPLPFQGEPGAVPFGTENADLAAIAKNIRTFTEPAATAHDHAAIKFALKQASTVVILGYGFHEQNNQILNIGHEYQGSNQKRCFATVFEVDDHNHLTIEQDLRSALGIHDLTLQGRPVLVDMKSKDLLKSLRPTLSSLMSR